MILALVAVAVVLGGAATCAGAVFSYRKAMRQAGRAWDGVAAGVKPAGGLFQYASVASLPEIAQRYFKHAIAEGTPLKTTIALEMRGVLFFQAEVIQASFL